MESNTVIIEKPENKFFTTDFSQKLLLLICTFLLTTLLGGLFGFYFQARTNARNYKNTLIESEREAAQDIYADVIKGIDERVYYAQIVNDNYALDPGKKGIPTGKWNNYVKAVDNWNININKRFDLVQLYFGDPVKKEVQIIHLKFVDLNLKLRKAKTANDRAMYNNIRSDISEINSAAASLSKKLIGLIQQDAVGRIPALRDL